MLRLAGPVLVEQILSMALAFVDQWLAGRHLGEAHLAAIGLIWYLLWLIPSVFSIVAIGATALVARQVGAGDIQEARRSTHQSLVLGAWMAVGVTLLSFFGGPTFVASMQLSEEAAALALQYWTTLLWVIPCFMVVQVGNACLRGAGDTYSGFLAMTLVNVVNAILGAALITGWGPFPCWGWRGLAIATSVGQAAGAIMILLLLWRGRGGLTLHWFALRYDRALSRRLLRIGVPGGVDMITVVGCHLVFVALINRLGVVPAAAHGLAVRLEALAYLPGTAFQIAAATLVGQYLGARDPLRARSGASAPV